MKYSIIILWENKDINTNLGIFLYNIGAFEKYFIFVIIWMKVYVIWRRNI